MPPPPPDAPPDRPLAATRCPWVMRMVWHDLLFAHWRLEPDLLRPHIPPRLEIDTFDGAAWIAVVPFRMTGIRLRCCPPMPTTHAFAELNVRTYVTDGERAGVWFCSLDADSRLAVAMARRAFHLNYRYAHMSCGRKGGWVEYGSRWRGTRFAARYRPTGDPFNAAPGSLERFLIERYCLYAASPVASPGAAQCVYRAEIDHTPWTLYRAEARIEANTMTAPLGIELPDVKPHLLFAERADVRAWPALPLRRPAP